MLEADQLACVRGDRPLFRRLNFSLAAGAALHVAGANGSGKTSLLRLLCGLSAPAEGDVRWNGENIRSLREEFYRDLVYIGHAPAVKDDLSPVENLMTSATLSGGSVSHWRACCCRRGCRCGYWTNPSPRSTNGRWTVCARP
ncbi:MAG: ccmA [Proteobacteria bacterium]|nr:ccmA [Pseudomonadota bacterium]